MIDELLKASGESLHADDASGRGDVVRHRAACDVRRWIDPIRRTPWSLRMTIHHDTYPAQVGNQVRDVPLIQVADDVAIALLITSDHGVEFMARAAGELAELLAPLRPEVIATNATLGIPVAIEVTRALGLDDYLVLHKTPKIHLSDAFTEPLSSITTDGQQMLRLDRARQELVRGRRVVLVDDVVSTGGTIAAGCRLLRSAGAELVGIGALLVEGTAWHETLGADAANVHSLGTLPLFRSQGDGWVVRDD